MPVLAADDFNRADAAANLGALWTSRQGSSPNQYGIVSNRAQPGSFSASDLCTFYNGATFPPDQYAQVAVYGITGTTNTNGLGPAVRIRTDNIGGGSSFLDMYEMCINAAGSNNVSLNRWVAGAFTNIAQRTQAFSDGDIARLAIQGTTLRMYRNGVQLGADVTDTSLTTGAAGMCLVSAMTAGALDSFEAGDVQPAVDSFNRTNSNSLGAGWTTVTAGWDSTGFAIVSNAAAPQALTGDDLEIYTGTSFGNDQYGQVKVTVAGINSGSGVGIALRGATDGSCYSIVVCKKATSNIEIARRNAGNAYTFLANPTASWVDGDTLKAKIVGNVITVYQNGVQVESPVTDSSGSALTTGAPGIVYSTSITSGSLDDFEADTIVAAETQSFYARRMRRVASGRRR